MKDDPLMAPVPQGKVPFWEPIFSEWTGVAHNTVEPCSIFTQSHLLGRFDVVGFNG